jgi:hypothetical protein
VPQTGIALDGIIPGRLHACANKELFAKKIKPINSIDVILKVISIRQRYFLQGFCCMAPLY